MRMRTYKSYDEYRERQCWWSVKKHRNIWAQREVLDEVARQIRMLRVDRPAIICHGVRNGFEVEYLLKALADLTPHIVGTEISEVAKENRHTIQWDFHEVKPTWIGQVTAIYSNSLDHSYDPQKAVDAWMRCISPEGACFIEWTADHAKDGSTDADCYRASLDEYVALAKAYSTQVITVHGKPTRMNRMVETALVKITHRRTVA